ncbi:MULTISPECIES: AMP-binding protein [unclassified Dyella]|uniref:AMP-binding protein n=1 Tax=unclassified Dyella TaxID=2634549 RepID=UPI000C8250AE|nr:MULTISPECIES: AMP-binding protein [unclassified Dyella]MDR3444124.1 AMP-binding protein [Dyella sp.]PMQ06386.1 Long-chain-fatty-acid--CoA ligase [Dyella sp. AD56]
MAIVSENLQLERSAPGRPLLAAGAPERPVVWRGARPVSAAHFMAHVQAVAGQLPAASAAVNLCEDRYAFLVAFCAIALRGQTNLLPSSRAPKAVAEVMAAHPGCYALGEQELDAPPAHYRHLPGLMDPPADIEGVFEIPLLPVDQVVAIGYTSGSTGVPKGNPKTWGSFHASNTGNTRALQGTVGEHFHVVATVPPQHMYGMEMSVLMPLLGDVAVHAGRPLLPADVAAALADVPQPRVLVTTPVHLRALIESGVTLPPIDAMVSATAPMPVELAQAAEARFGAPLLEVFGSTETCVFASRRSAFDEPWSLYDDVQLHPQPDGTLVRAPQLAQPMALADIVTLHDGGRRFRLCGRHSDLLDIAGKRASLGDLTRRLQAIPGVLDGVVFQLESGDALGVHRIAAVAVAPGLDEHTILDAFRESVDPVFLPRPLKLVDSLPRNETGKLPRAALLALL